MTIIECPGCKARVDIDRTDVEKQEQGLHLIVKCPECTERFLLQRVAEVRQRLQVAEYGYTVDQTGQEIRVKLQ
jgi:hypothetical protein